MASRGDTTAQRQRQRARNKGTGLTSTHGSSGISAVAGRLDRIEFDRIADVAVHVADLQALFQSGQILANRAVTGTLVAGPEWAHEMLEAALASQGKAVYVRFYVVPLDAVLPDPEGDLDGEEA